MWFNLPCSFTQTRNLLWPEGANNKHIGLRVLSCIWDYITCPVKSRKVNYSDAICMSLTGPWWCEALCHRALRGATSHECDSTESAERYSRGGHSLPACPRPILWPDTRMLYRYEDPHIWRICQALQKHTYVQGPFSNSLNMHKDAEFVATS